jgi:hypothetical protein
LTLLRHLRKDASQETSWEWVGKLWAVSLADVGHCTINRRFWTLEVTVSQSPWTEQNLGRYSRVLLWSFCFVSFFQMEILDNGSLIEFVHDCRLTYGS